QVGIFAQVEYLRFSRKGRQSENDCLHQAPQQHRHRPCWFAYTWFIARANLSTSKSVFWRVPAERAERARAGIQGRQIANSQIHLAPALASVGRDTRGV